MRWLWLTQCPTSIAHCSVLPFSQPFSRAFCCWKIEHFDVSVWPHAQCEGPAPRCAIVNSHAVIFYHFPTGNWVSVPMKLFAFKTSPDLSFRLMCTISLLACFCAVARRPAGHCPHTHGPGKASCSSKPANQAAKCVHTMNCKSRGEFHF